MEVIVQMNVDTKPTNIMYTICLLLPITQEDYNVILRSVERGQVVLNSGSSFDSCAAVYCEMEIILEQYWFPGDSVASCLLLSKGCDCIAASYGYRPMIISFSRQISFEKELQKCILNQSSSKFDRDII